MGMIAGVAINEAVSLLESLSPARLETLRGQYPRLSGQLGLGIYAGEDDEHPARQSDPHLNEKASIMVAALTEAWKSAEVAMITVSRSVRTARQQRLFSQAFVLLGSSSSLATMALGQNRAAVIAAVLTLLAALGNLGAEYNEKLLSPQAGNVYDVFQRLGEGAYKAKAFAAEIELELKYQTDGSALQTLVANGNELCEQLNGSLVQLLTKIPPTAG